MVLLSVATSALEAALAIDVMIGTERSLSAKKMRWGRRASKMNGHLQCTVQAAERLTSLAFAPLLRDEQTL